uniref:Uncharacterized protein n=1 Tax=Anguilla anguilla TaxID=7936 RepID=A0A0E9TUQ8_ANGAN
MLNCFLSADIKKLSVSSLDSRLLIAFGACYWHRARAVLKNVQRAILRLRNKNENS